MTEAAKSSGAIGFTLNGASVEVQASPMARLLDILRVDLGLTGTKEGCGEGECGACTVLLDGDPVCACLIPMTQVAGRRVVTIEGLADSVAAPSVRDFERVFVAEGGTQCGACTPGMMMTLAAFLARSPTPCREEMRDFASGTLCRCTGYERIFRAVEVATGQRAAEGADER